MSDCLNILTCLSISGEVFCRPQCCLEAVVYLDFSEYVIYVGLDRMETDAKPIGNLLVACA